MLSGLSISAIQALFLAHLPCVWCIYLIPSLGSRVLVGCSESKPKTDLRRCDCSPRQTIDKEEVCKENKIAHTVDNSISLDVVF